MREVASVTTDYKYMHDWNLSSSHQHLMTEAPHFIDVATPFLKADGTVMDDVFVNDGLHLNDKGNRIWATAIKSVLMEIEAEFEMAKASGQ